MGRLFADHLEPAVVGPGDSPTPLWWRKVERPKTPRASADARFPDPGWAYGGELSREVRRARACAKRQGLQDSQTVELCMASVLAFELQGDEQMGFYHTTSGGLDYIRLCARARASGGAPGVASAAGSLCAYGLGITAAGSGGQRLLFERFLNRSASRCLTSTRLSASSAASGGEIEYVTERIMAGRQGCPDHPPSTA